MPSENLSWALIVATLNRIDTLEGCVSCAIAQTRQPAEIVIVDASTDLEGNRKRIAQCVARNDISLLHVAADVRSSAAQRNQGIRLARSDILFLIDDDALMHWECAENIMQAYESNWGREFVMLGCATSEVSPVSSISGALRKQKGAYAQSFRHQSKLTRWILREVFMMSTAYSIVAYDRPDRRYKPTKPVNIDQTDVSLEERIGGFRMTVRRDAALRELFDDALLGYSPAEDMDFSYRMGRLGLIGTVRSALLYHHEAAAGRTKRYSVTAFRLMNPAFFYRKNAASLDGAARKFAIWVLRHILAEFLKDLLSRRWTFPQFMGSLSGAYNIPEILRMNDANINESYRKIQQRYL